MNNQLSAKDIREIKSYLKTIQTYSALVEAKVNKADPGGVGTAQDQQKKSKKSEMIESIRAKFHK
jgi:hypothetical protein